MSELLDLAALAERCARAAGALLAEHAARPFAGIDAKSSATDLVSDADRASEALITRLLAAERPDDGILAEESASRPSRNGLTWVIDPLDGTTNYLFRVPQWCVSIACEDAAGGLVGCIHDPVRDETFVGLRGGLATLDGEPIAVSGATALDRALIATGFGYEQRVRESQARQLGGVIGHVRDIRRAGSAALDLAWVACGRLDGFYEAGVQHWDWAAGSVLVTAAGGVVTHASSVHGPAQIVAAAPGIYAALDRLLGESAALAASE